MNGTTNGIVPTFDLTGNNNSGWGGNMGEWILGIIALGMLGNGGWGGFGGFGGGAAGMYEFPWLLAGQQGINTNTNKPATTVSYYSQWDATDDDNLKACGVYVNNACECSIKVFVDGVLKGTTNNVPLSYEGFHTIQLSNMVPVKKGQKFRIEVTINSKNPVRLPFELTWRDFNETYPNRYDNAHANSDESGYISNGLLVDIASKYPSCNICMNVYTEYKKLLDTKIDVSTLSFNNMV